MLFNIALLASFIPAILAGPVPTKAGDIIPGQYIVVLKAGTDVNTHQRWVTGRRANGGGIVHTYNLDALQGYSGKFDEATIKEIADREEVAYVEPDRIVTTQELITQDNAPSWGLTRISHRNPGSTSYVYDSSAGEGITAYVIDTGVLPSHVQFEGRAATGFNAITNENDQDGNGHGTHVAGTIVGKDVGIAKNAEVIGVKVLSSAGSGSNSGVIAGINWSVQDARSKGRIGKAVANMSLGGAFSAAVNNAVNAAVNAGIPFAVAAGNSNANAANFSPASAANVICVGATERSDARASYSNFGAPLKVFAPGSGITSSWINSNTAFNTISGTSMASPHVAGVAAYLMALESITNPSDVLARIIALSLTGKVPNPGAGSPNRLLYNGSGQ